MNLSRDKLLLYAVTDRSWLGEDSLETVVEEALKGGATMVLLREKEISHEGMVELARRLKPVCASYGVPLIINDDVQAALEADADGVHVGQEDLGVVEARKLLGPDKIIGASAHNVAEALEAVRQGADYLGSGAVFGSATKTNVSCLPMEELKRICAAVSVPVVAIGGISEKNAGSLAGTGIAGIAVISAIFAAADKREAAARLRATAERLAERREET